MPAKLSEIEKAYRRVTVLKTIVDGERRRAESQPTSARNKDMGYIDHTVTSVKDARDTLILLFNDMQLFLDHLHIAHMAASFELEAIPRIASIIGELRRSLEDARGNRDYWPRNFLRSQKSFEGLYDIEQIMSLPAVASANFDLVRRARNKFSHGVKLEEAPGIESGEAYQTLVGMLNTLK